MIMNNWLEHPELYYPTPVTIVNVMRWHVALMQLAGQKNRELNAHLYKKGELCIIRMFEYKTSDEIEGLYRRDREYMQSLGYYYVAMIETCMLIGRDLWYRKRNGHAACVDNKTLDTISIRDLEQWAKIYEVPLSNSEGGNLDRAIEYTFGKIWQFMNAYIEAVA